MNCLNLGCGSRYHLDWINIDISAHEPYVQSYDLRRGIPYPDNTFDLVYHSHLLEHFPRNEAHLFLKECQRVLKVGGVLRVVVPNLEEIARLYLQALDGALQDDIRWQHNYEWMMLELYDQAVRERSGGGMVDHLQLTSGPDVTFIRQRLGGEAERMLRPNLTAQPENLTPRWHFLARLIKIRGNWAWVVRNLFIRIFLSTSDMRALTIGRFRLSGEVHHWMYDRFSLAQILISAGFTNPVQQTPTTSLIQGWVGYNLDTEPDGTIYKPDSLYLEAVKSG
jgi:SAM-dependent methyltransferase